MMGVFLAGWALGALFICGVLWLAEAVENRRMREAVLLWWKRSNQ